MRCPALKSDPIWLEREASALAFSSSLSRFSSSFCRLSSSRLASASSSSGDFTLGGVPHAEVDVRRTEDSGTAASAEDGRVGDVVRVNVNSLATPSDVLGIAEEGRAGDVAVASPKLDSLARSAASSSVRMECAALEGRDEVATERAAADCGRRLT